MTTNPLFKADAYEFTMLSSFVESGLADGEASFELFTRRLPEGRRFGLSAGLGRFLELLPEVRVDAPTVESLRKLGLVTPAAEAWLLEREGGPLFRGSVSAYPEGSLYSPHSPLVTVTGCLGEALLLETLLLSIFNHDSAVASAAARMVLASGGTPIIEMGSRRTDDEAALSAARAAYIAGFASTSNVAAALKWDLPTAGTAAHAYTLAHESELEAFKHQLATWGPGTTLLVDTYDTREGLRRAVEAARSFGESGPGAVRIDSGDLLVEAHEARLLLDSLGATATKIVVSSDLDEFLMAALAAADSPIDRFGAGTRVVTGSGHPTAGFVYKLVEVEGRPVAKASEGKKSVGGRKLAYETGAGGEEYSLRGELRGRPLQERVVEGGLVLPQPPLEEVRARAAASLATLPEAARTVAAGGPWRTAVLAPQEGGLEESLSPSYRGSEQ